MFDIFQYWIPGLDAYFVLYWTLGSVLTNPKNRVFIPNSGKGSVDSPDSELVIVSDINENRSMIIPCALCPKSIGRDNDFTFWVWPICPIKTWVWQSLCTLPLTGDNYSNVNAEHTDIQIRLILLPSCSKTQNYSDIIPFTTLLLPPLRCFPLWQCSNPIDKTPIGGQGASPEV